MYFKHTDIRTHTHERERGKERERSEREGEREIRERGRERDKEGAKERDTLHPFLGLESMLYYMWQIYSVFQHMVVKVK